ncbi:uncharacterized protein SPSK_05644 [Sporothrix schenckii 1099-18]|uniref:Uncharacterized protein n=1 Tax=Sporothrix schenckii 1099-18 TaxID=1397361 RepID=A0A0F2LSA5_SPOSC|nr:uncharacterized protein SPSK_05644 [Sporothrix schenckii 1099-18]KJR80372.1 hypothetical protein SPSK_05644 [Sporothrix schenckii 1099-18]
MEWSARDQVFGSAFKISQSRDAESLKQQFGFETARLSVRRHRPADMSALETGHNRRKKPLSKKRQPKRREPKRYDNGRDEVECPFFSDPLKGVGLDMWSSFSFLCGGWPPSFPEVEDRGLVGRSCILVPMSQGNELQRHTKRDPIAETANGN